MQAGEIGVGDIFFELGDHSLSALSMIVSVHERYQQNVPLGTLIKYPTIKQLAKAIVSAEVECGELVPMRMSGQKLPIFLLHPSGPYYIGGWSFSGILAFEMCVQLQQYDIEVGGLFIIDSYMRRSHQSLKLELSLLLDWFAWELIGGDQGIDNSTILHSLRSQSNKQKFQSIYRLAIEKGVLPEHTKLATIQQYFEVFKNNLYAGLQYKPQKVNVNITLFRSANPMPSVLLEAHALLDSAYSDSMNGWSNYTTKQIHRHTVAADHLSIIRNPAVNYIGKLLQDNTQT